MMSRENSIKEGGTFKYFVFDLETPLSSTKVKLGESNQDKSVASILNEFISNKDAISIDEERQQIVDHFIEALVICLEFFISREREKFDGKLLFSEIYFRYSFSKYLTQLIESFKKIKEELENASEAEVLQRLEDKLWAEIWTRIPKLIGIPITGQDAFLKHVSAHNPQNWSKVLWEFI
ncbi:MAG: hypothetical protein ACFFCW_35115, partial [Candidatus Hodarchaeota archaeon]